MGQAPFTVQTTEHAQAPPARRHNCILSVVRFALKEVNRNPIISCEESF
jgi:hypothetical protein